MQQERNRAGVEIKESTAIDKILGQVGEQQRRQAIHSVYLLPPKDTQGMLTTLITGIKYMITVNIDVSDGLFNGVYGILRKIEREIYIEISDPSIEKKDLIQQ